MAQYIINQDFSHYMPSRVQGLSREYFIFNLMADAEGTQRECHCRHYVSHQLPFPKRGKTQMTICNWIYTDHCEWHLCSWSCKMSNLTPGYMKGEAKSSHCNRGFNFAQRIYKWWYENLTRFSYNGKNTEYPETFNVHTSSSTIGQIDSDNQLFVWLSF